MKRVHLLSILADECDRSAKLYPNFAPMLERSPPSGPRIRPSEPFDATTMILERWEQEDNALREFFELAKRLEPLLREVGVTLSSAQGSTPDWRVLNWVMGDVNVPEMRTGVIPHGNAFRLVAIAVRCIAEEPADSGQQNGQSKKIVPDNPDVGKLANKIQRERKTVPHMIDIARDFTNGDEKRAKSLLRQLRRFPHLLD